MVAMTCVDVVERDLETFEDVGAAAGSLQLELGAAGDDFLAVGDVLLQRPLERQDRGWVPRSTRASMLTPKVDCSAVCLKRLFSTFIGCASRFSSMMARMPVRSDSSRRSLMPSSLPSLTMLGDPLEQGGLVDLVGQLGDDDLVAAAAWRLLDEGLGPDDDAAAAGGVGGLDPLATEDRAAGREVRTGDDLHQIFDGGLGVVDQDGDGVADLVEVVRRDIGRHADGDAGAAVEQQVRQARRQDAAAPRVEAS